MTDITCDTALERMLEADPAELRGETDSALARHIDGCPRCAAVAVAFLEEHAALDDAMATLATGTAVDFDPAANLDPATAYAAADAAADAALAAIREEEAGDVVSLPDRRRATEGHAQRPGSPPGARAHGKATRSRWARAAWIPLAAAAALAAVFVLRPNGPISTPVPTSSPTPEATATEPRVAVTTPANRDAAILETDNPNITIVWLFAKEES